MQNRYSYKEFLFQNGRMIHHYWMCVIRLGTHGQSTHQMKRLKTNSNFYFLFTKFCTLGALKCLTLLVQNYGACKPLKVDNLMKILGVESYQEFNSFSNKVWTLRTIKTLTHLVQNSEHLEPSSFLLQN